MQPTNLRNVQRVRREKLHFNELMTKRKPAKTKQKPIKAWISQEDLDDGFGLFYSDPFGVVERLKNDVPVLITIIE